MPRHANKYPITPEMLQIGIDKVIKKTESRLLQRADKIQTIINEEALQPYWQSFKLCWTGFKINDLETIIHDCSSIIQTWDGGKYHKPIKTNKLCFEKTRNFWCREKFKPIGSKLFYPIFCQLYKYIDGFTTVCKKDQILLFIDIMNRLLDTDIKFTRTSAKPLILHATFFKTNKFKDFCGTFLEIFNFSECGIKWGAVKVTKSVKKKNNNRATSQYIRDPNRAISLHDSFVRHLKNIKLQIINCNNMNVIKYAMRKFKDWIDNNGESTSNMIPMNDDIKENVPIINGNGRRNNRNNNNQLRSFQSANNFINRPNRIHNMNRFNHRYNRNNARELHILNMRMPTMYHCNYYIPTTSGCCCHHILPQYAFNTVHYTQVPQVPPQPQIRHVPMPIINQNEEIQSISRSPMTITPPQPPQQQPTQSIPFPEIINTNNSNNSNIGGIERVSTFRDNNNGDLNGNVSILDTMTFDSMDDPNDYLNDFSSNFMNGYEFDGDSHYHI